MRTPTLRNTVSASLIHALDTAYNAARDPARIKALIFTNPHNPLGQCYTKAVITEALCWCGRKGIHFVGDEVYGLSEFRRGKEDRGFVSTLSLVAGERGGKGEEEKSDEDGAPARNSNNLGEIGRSDAHDITPAAGSRGKMQEQQEINDYPVEKDIDLSRVHTIWSMSKDLGCSGLRMVCPMPLFSFTLRSTVPSRSPPNPYHFTFADCLSNRPPSSLKIIIPS